VAQQGAVAIWQMDFLEAAIQWETQASAKLQWMLPLTLPERSLCQASGPFRNVVGF